MYKKIMFIIPSLQMGGAEKIVLTIVKELRNRNYQVYLVILENKIFYELDKNMKIFKLTKKKKYSNFAKLLLSPYFAYKIYQIIKKYNIKVIQSHLYRANIINSMLKILDNNLNIQIVNHGLISRYRKMGIKGKINLSLIKYFYPKVDTIISLSKYMEYDMVELVNFSKTKKIIINNPYDIKNIEKLKLEKHFDDPQFNFLKSKKYIISVGRLIKLKRNDILIKALSILSSDIELIIIGDGDEKENLIQLTKNLGVENRVYFLGQVINPFYYINNADIFILTSENEGFPNVLIESMICKTKVISTDCKSGPREILAPNTDFRFSLKNNIEITNYGILIPINNVKLLVKSINSIFNKNIYIDVEKAYKRVLDFSIDKIINKYEKVLNENSY